MDHATCSSSFLPMSHPAGPYYSNATHLLGNVRALQGAARSTVSRPRMPWDGRVWGAPPARRYSSRITSSTS